MTYPDRDLDDVNAHLDALFLIGDAGKTNPEALDNRLRLAAHADNAPEVMKLPRHLRSRTPTQAPRTPGTPQRPSR